MKYSREEREMIRMFPNSYFALGYEYEMNMHRIWKETVRLIVRLDDNISKLFSSLFSRNRYLD